MKTTFATAIALITAGTMLAGTASATPLMRTVYCNDGSIFKVGDELTDEQICSQHGGVKRHRGTVGLDVKTNHGIPPVPAKINRVRASR